jgi:hypothetical protein
MKLKTKRNKIKLKIENEQLKCRGGGRISPVAEIKAEGR